jgi:hypothetical protein
MATTRKGLDRGSLSSVIEKISTFRAKQRGPSKKAGDQLLSLLELAKAESTEPNVMLILTEAIELRQQEKSRARSMFSRNRASSSREQQGGELPRKDSLGDIRNLDTGEVGEIEAVNEVVEESLRKSLGESPANSPRSGRTSPAWDAATIDETGEEIKNGNAAGAPGAESPHSSVEGADAAATDVGTDSVEGGKEQSKEAGASLGAEDAAGAGTEAGAEATPETEQGNETGDGDEAEAAPAGKKKEDDGSYSAGVDQEGLTGLTKKEREAEFFAQLAKQKREDAEKKVLTAEEIASKEHDALKSKMLERQMRTFKGAGGKRSSTSEVGRGRGARNRAASAKRMSQPPAS